MRSQLCRKRVRLLASTPGVDLDAVDAELAFRPLAYAIHMGSVPMVRMLLVAKADPNVRPQDHHYSMVEKVLDQHTNSTRTAILKLLLEHKADPNFRVDTTSGYQGILLSEKECKLLLEHNADPDFEHLRGSKIKSPMASALLGTESPDIVKALINHRADVNKLVLVENTSPPLAVLPIALAYALGRCRSAKLLLEAGAKLDCMGSGELPPFESLGDHLPLLWPWLTEGWRPHRHASAPVYIEAVVRTMMALRAIPGTVVYTLPSELLFVIFALLPVD